MLKRLHLRNFTVFEDADFEFGPGLNVLVGANGTGKSHVLKVGYTLLYDLLHTIQASAKDRQLDLENAHKNLQEARARLASKLINVFQPAPFWTNELMRRGSSDTGSGASIYFGFSTYDFGNAILLQTNANAELDKTWPSKIESHFRFTDPVFIPAKEVLTQGWLLPLYDRREIPIDETYPDLLRLLMGPPLRQPEPTHIIEKLQQLIGGKVEEEGGHFYLSAPDQPRMEMNLVAEGFRKFATLYKLLANGTLTPETTLFWDEPEANLNPALLKDMAAVLAELARAGFQIILATHSLFLLKELHILSQQAPLPIKYFGLSADNGGPTRVATADNLELLPDIVALDAELDQSDRFQRVLDQEDADGN